MFKNAEIISLGADGIPEALTGRLLVPHHIASRGHLLRQYVAESLIPDRLELVLLEDLDGFFQRMTKHPLGFLSQCRGLYVAQNHVWSATESYDRVNRALKQEYAIEVRTAVLLPRERIDYWTLIHEALHDVFNRLPRQKRTQIVRSASASYASSGKLQDMLDIARLDLSHFLWDADEIARIIAGNKRRGRNPLDGFGHVYTFGNLAPAEQLQTADEFISHFFSNGGVRNRWSPKHLSPIFRATLRSVGYNVDDPPDVNNAHKCDGRSDACLAENRSAFHVIP